MDGGPGGSRECGALFGGDGTGGSDDQAFRPLREPPRPALAPVGPPPRPCSANRARSGPNAATGAVSVGRAIDLAVAGVARLIQDEGQLIAERGVDGRADIARRPVGIRGEDEVLDGVVPIGIVDDIAADLPLQTLETGRHDELLVRAAGPHPAVGCRYRPWCRSEPARWRTARPAGPPPAPRHAARDATASAPGAWSRSPPCSKLRRSALVRSGHPPCTRGCCRQSITSRSGRVLQALTG